jgi:hypothetical protein
MWRIWGNEECQSRQQLLGGNSLQRPLMTTWDRTAAAATMRVAVRSVLQLLLVVTASGVRSSPTVFTLMMEVACSSETSVLTRATWPNIPGGSILHSYRPKPLKSYVIICWYVLSHCVIRNQRHALALQIRGYLEVHTEGKEQTGQVII